MPVAPYDLPSGHEFSPPFETDYSFGANVPAPQNGVNSDQWLGIRFDLINNATAADITEVLSNGSLRVGVHVISLPDGSSIILPKNWTHN